MSEGNFVNNHMINIVSWTYFFTRGHLHQLELKFVFLWFLEPRRYVKDTETQVSNTGFVCANPIVENLVPRDKLKPRSKDGDSPKLFGNEW